MFIKLPKNKKDEVIQDIQTFYWEEKGEKIGLIAAENVFDFFIKQLGPYLYNQGVYDAKVMVTQTVQNIEEDLSSLERPIVTKQ